MPKLVTGLDRVAELLLIDQEDIPRPICFQLDADDEELLDWGWTQVSVRGQLVG